MRKKTVSDVRFEAFGAISVELNTNISEIFSVSIVREPHMTVTHVIARRDLS
jgi:hypothetical protein